MAIETMLVLKDISWHLPEKEILHGIDLTVPDGKLVVITGPNGGGKTSLAKLIAGIEKPDSGKILLDGKDITELDVTERARAGVSFAFQQPVRFKGFTVRRLLELSAGQKLSVDKLCEMLGRVGLCGREYLGREVDATLSGGEIKRIEIATVLARHTKLSLFDEPEAGIDLWSFSNLIDVFQSMRGKLQGTLIIISHQERILQIADELAVISGGTLKEKGPAQEILPGLMAGNIQCDACAKREAVFG